MNPKDMQLPLMLVIRKTASGEDYEGALCLDTPHGALYALHDPVKITDENVGEGPALIMKAATAGLQAAWESFNKARQNQKAGGFSFAQNIPGKA